jgi:hypothetical protein
MLLSLAMKTQEVAELLIKATEFRDRAREMRTRSHGFVRAITRADLLATAKTYEDLRRAPRKERAASDAIAAASCSLGERSTAKRAKRLNIAPSSSSLGASNVEGSLLFARCDGDAA